MYLDFVQSSLHSQNNQIFGTISIFEDDTLTIHCVDENGIDNNSPPHFNIQTYLDMPPEILVFFMDTSSLSSLKLYLGLGSSSQ